LQHGDVCEHDIHSGALQFAATSATQPASATPAAASKPTIAESWATAAATKPSTTGAT
jgi:hypothetical protein